MYSSDFSNNIVHKNNKPYVFDKLRKKYVRFTPEESVRQHMVYYLIDTLGYPRSLIRLEETIAYGDLYKRVDILIRDNIKAQPIMLIECKASYHKINQTHLDQLAMYNQTIQAPFIVLTNGLCQVCFAINREKHTYRLLTTIPFFTTLVSKKKLI